MSNLSLLLNTVRYLRPMQIASRLARHAPRSRSVSRAPLAARPRARAYADPAPRAASLVAPDVFRFLAVERRCAAAADWEPAGAARLWIYNLHYFDDLVAADAAQRGAWHARLLERWVAENAVGEGPGWEPYPLSRRIVNWIKWALAGNALSPIVATSLAVQVRWLRKRLEYHLLGNHLLANAKALLYAGLYFAGAEAERWRTDGAAIVGRQVTEQVLADGGHFERSTMYHALVLEDLLDIVNVVGAYGDVVPGAWLDAIGRMRRWAAAMTHPDGGIAFFNDAAFGVAPERAELEAYAARLGLPAELTDGAPLVVLEPSGYLRARADAAVLFCDCAPVGPSYIPGHAHADTLSFELSLNGSRLFVNSGTSEYGLGTERERQRGTPAHNTVVVDGQNSTEVWAGFRVARRARARLESATMADATVRIDASHDGYRRLAGRNEHRRVWTLGGAELRIDDSVSGNHESAVARFHLHPSVAARAERDGSVALGVEGLAVRMRFEGAARIDVETGTWHPRFGVVEANRCVAALFARSALSTRVSWA